MNLPAEYPAMGRWRRRKKAASIRLDFYIEYSPQKAFGICFRTVLAILMFFGSQKAMAF